MKVLIKKDWNYKTFLKAGEIIDMNADEFEDLQRSGVDWIEVYLPKKNKDEKKEVKE